MSGLNLAVNQHHQYGRPPGKVLLQPADCSSCGYGLDANHSRIKAGMAWWYRYYAKHQLKDWRISYEQVEDEARVEKIGLWQEPDPLPPWDYRPR